MHKSVISIGRIITNDNYTKARVKRQMYIPTLRMVFESKLYFQANTTILFISIALISTGLSSIFLVVLFVNVGVIQNTNKHEE